MEAVEWRWAFRIAASFSFLIALVLMVTVLEPRRKVLSVSCGLSVWGGWKGRGKVWIVERWWEGVALYINWHSTLHFTVAKFLL